MIINGTYTIRVISTDNPSNFITKVEVLDDALCDVSHNGAEIIITTKDVLGESSLIVEDFDGRGYNMPIIVDSINYTYDIKYKNQIVNNDNPAIIYYSENNTVEQFEIVENRYSELFNRFLTEDDSSSGDFNTNYHYEHASNGIQ